MREPTRGAVWVLAKPRRGRPHKTGLSTGQQQPKRLRGRPGKAPPVKKGEGIGRLPTQDMASQEQPGSGKK
jgi:hypothetical protein